MDKPKNNNWFKRHKVLSVLGILLLLGIIGSASGSSKHASNTADTSSSTIPVTTADKAGVNQGNEQP